MKMDEYFCAIFHRFARLYPVLYFMSDLFNEKYVSRPHRQLNNVINFIHLFNKL